MFAKATRKFVEEVDPNGCLIPVSRLNENDNLGVFSLVIKRKPFWFWKQPKYMPTDFTLNDVLLGNDPIDTVVTETDFLKYNRTANNNAAGEAEADIGPGNLSIEGKGVFKLASSFGSLKKQEIDVQKLLDDTEDRHLDFQHSLLKQTLRRKGDVFALVKERIITTQTCTVTEEIEEEGSCSAFLAFTVPKKIQVTVKNGSVHFDSKVFMDIPSNTALAYSVMELDVKRTGQFELCLMPDSTGCFEVDGLNETNRALLYSAGSTPLQKLKEELDQVQVHFKVLSGLCPSTRLCLFQQITFLLKNKAAIGILDQELEYFEPGTKYDLYPLDNTPSLKEAVKSVLELFNEKESVTVKQQLESSALTAISVLTSALDAMTESALGALESCCCYPTIQTLYLLVHKIIENKTCSLKDSTLAPLAEESTCRKAQELFGSSKVMLLKEKDLIKTQISSQPGHYPLILFIAILGLGSLACSADQQGKND